MQIFIELIRNRRHSEKALQEQENKTIHQHPKTDAAYKKNLKALRAFDRHECDGDLFVQKQVYHKNPQSRNYQTRDWKTQPATLANEAAIFFQSNRS